MFPSVRFTINEYIQNRKLLIKLAYVHMSQSTIRSTWGVVWVYIHDILYFTAFVLFRILLTGNSGGDGIALDLISTEILCFVNKVLSN